MIRPISESYDIVIHGVHYVGIEGFNVPRHTGHIERYNVFPSLYRKIKKLIDGDKQ